MISACNIEDNLFDEESVIVNCILDDRYYTRAMINNDCTEYSFVDRSIAHEICEVLRINFVKLLKSRKMREYNDQSNESVTHVIYSSMIIMNHIESSTSLMITKLDQQVIILSKFWMKKHEVSYHDLNDIVFFWLRHCIHINSFEFSFSKQSTREEKVTIAVMKKIRIQPLEILKRRSILVKRLKQKQTRKKLSESWRKELDKIITSRSAIKTREVMMKNKLFENQREKKKIDRIKSKKARWIFIRLMQNVIQTERSRDIRRIYEEREHSASKNRQVNERFESRSISRVSWFSRRLFEEESRRVVFSQKTRSSNRTEEW
jgi:hypothetical protein